MYYMVTYFVFFRNALSFRKEGLAYGQVNYFFLSLKSFHNLYFLSFRLKNVSVNCFCTIYWCIACNKPIRRGCCSLKKCKIGKIESGSKSN